MRRFLSQWADAHNIPRWRAYRDHAHGVLISPDGHPVRTQRVGQSIYVLEDPPNVADTVDLDRLVERLEASGRYVILRADEAARLGVQR